jgi:hypothetical protein
VHHGAPTAKPIICPNVMAATIVSVMMIGSFVFNSQKNGNAKAIANTVPV